MPVHLLCSLSLLLANNSVLLVFFHLESMLGSISYAFLFALNVLNNSHVFSSNSIFFYERPENFITLVTVFFLIE